MSGPDLYCDRIRPPEQTLAAVAPHLMRYGITRVARQTSLDIIGIPVFAAFRPNAATLAVSQGKGLSDAAAKASAVMEALEFAIAERPECPSFIASARELHAAGEDVFMATGTMPIDLVFPLDAQLSWVRGTNIIDGSPVAVPLDMVRFSGVAQELGGICQHTNGLASGNCRDEALFHGLCELIERDAGSLWALTGPAERQCRVLEAQSFGDGEVERLAGLVTAAGLGLRLFDQTSDVGVPTIMAEISPRGGRGLYRHEHSSGSGTHPVAARAAIRAITEAAQSRVTMIAAARDDMERDLYAGAAASMDDAGARRAEPPKGLEAGTGLDALLAHLISSLAARGIERLIAVPLGGEDADIVVLKVLSDQLEDVGVNLNWRPGQRALAHLAGLAA